MNQDKFLTTIKGYKKLGTLILTVLIALFGQQAGIDEETITLVTGAGMSFMVGQGIADSGSKQSEYVPNPKIQKL